MEFTKIYNLYLKNIPLIDVWRDMGILDQCSNANEEMELAVILNAAMDFHNKYLCTFDSCWEIGWITNLMSNLYYKCKESDVNKVFIEFRSFVKIYGNDLMSEEECIHVFTDQYQRN